MNAHGVLEKITEQLIAYKARTTHAPQDDGVALLMNGDTYNALLKDAGPGVDPLTERIHGCHVIRSQEVPLGPFRRCCCGGATNRTASR